MLEIIEHTLLDCINIVPFLFLTYVLMEWLEHKAGKRTQAIVEKSGHFGPVIGSALGVIPQCGFSAAASGLYAGRVITLGTLIAIFLSTSDEMLPIMLSASVPIATVGKILAAKVVIGMAAGMAIDFILPKKEEDHHHIHEICEHENCHCGEGNNVLLSSLIHTLKIMIFIIITTFVLNLILHNGGEEVLEEFLLNRPIMGPLLAGLVGLIPNCASSVVITSLYVQEAMSLGAMMSGLLVNAGVGILVLFRSNSDKWENVKIVGILFGIGVVAGIILDLIGISF